ncbi:hypothetical protein ACNFJ7_11435 [Sphingomonas sp. HT-1]|uniref:hypothetical protein n=1 Tax=unclassified Sphingomonas TaxID=196159 RepID=UPI0002EB57E7|nr:MULTISPECIES: hypothetical protein [unclassified Sphingomonas]KTF70464.1 hypothetical protein ATB93_04315 [Sphingomonas sp. WG]
MKSWLIAAACCLPFIDASPARAQAQQQSDISQQIINSPTPETFTVYGLSAKPAVVKDKNVQGGRAIRVPIAGGSDQPWSVGLISAINQPVKKGDKLVVAVWARAEKLPEGATTAKIATIQVGLAKEPYTTVFKGEAEVGTEWKMVHVAGTVDRDYAPGDISVSLHLATAKQVLDIGPILLLDLNK